MDQGHGEKEQGDKEQGEEAGPGAWRERAGREGAGRGGWTRGMERRSRERRSRERRLEQGHGDKEQGEKEQGEKAGAGAWREGAGREGWSRGMETRSREKRGREMRAPHGSILRQLAVCCLPLQVPKPCCSSLGVQSSLGVHCSIQRRIALFTACLPPQLRLPGSAGQQSQSPAGDEPAHLASQPALQVLLSPDVPHQTLAGFVKASQGLHRSSPGHYERLVCLLLLQACMGLEHLRAQNAVRGDLCPDNLLLVQCPRPPRSQQGKEVPPGLCLPRLLISSFLEVQGQRRALGSGREQERAGGCAAPPCPAEDELNVALLICHLLHLDSSPEQALGFRARRLPDIPSLSIYSSGLRRLATLLLHADPCQRVSVEQAKSILQVLLWGPRQELFARSKKSLRLLGSWVQVKRALLLLRLAEDSAGGVGSPGLEEWLCCQYFKEVTEHSLYQATQALYGP
ncbi:inactive tyrosine-protein kinase PRAG1-like [Pogoniulus pusillus]|uniref:inactive tyrosine-protein kinase PRAG1-like n=1 Tax=Pogoniulus pusillus TaxID=488313 RepID=UPI0030B96EC6